MNLSMISMSPEKLEELCSNKDESRYETHINRWLIGRGYVPHKTLFSHPEFLKLFNEQEFHEAYPIAKASVIKKLSHKYSNSLKDVNRESRRGRRIEEWRGDFLIFVNGVPVFIDVQGAFHTKLEVVFVDYMKKKMALYAGANYIVVKEREKDDFTRSVIDMEKLERDLFLVENRSLKSKI